MKNIDRLDKNKICFSMYTSMNLLFNKNTDVLGIYHRNVGNRWQIVRPVPGGIIRIGISQMRCVLKYTCEELYPYDYTDERI